MKQVTTPTDAVVLAGDRIASMPINEENKAFLDFRGEPLFAHVVRSLLRSTRVGKIILVGPREKLLQGVARTSGDSEGRISVAEQGFNIIENAVIGFLTSIGVSPGPSELMNRFDDLINSSHGETSILVLSCDLPLLTHWEIDEFLTQAEKTEADYAIGLSDESVMAAFAPRVHSPGISMSLYHLAESRCRHNNLHLIKPLKVSGLDDMERMYELRYQKKFVNTLKATLHLLRNRVNTLGALRLFFYLQISRRLGERRRGRLYEAIRARTRLRHILGFISSLLGLKTKGIFTHYGGAVVDVDNGQDLEIANLRYNDWMKHQQSIHDRLTDSGA